MLLGDRHDKVLAGLHVARPRVDMAVSRLPLERGARHYSRRRAAHRYPRHPRDDALVANLHMRHVSTHTGHNACAFMTKQQRAAEAVIMHLVQL